MAEQGAKGRRFVLNAGASNWLWLTIVLIAVDQWTKRLILQRLEPYDEIYVLPVLDIVRWHNEGAAWSILADAGGWQRWFFVVVSSVISIGLLVWMKNHPDTRMWMGISLALILGGAIGNLIDRINLGYVIDFIDVYYDRWHWPAFNVADSAISIGIIMLIIDSFWFDHAELSTFSGDIKK